MHSLIHRFIQRCLFGFLRMAEKSHIVLRHIVAHRIGKIDLVHIKNFGSPVGFRSLFQSARTRTASFEQVT